MMNKKKILIIDDNPDIRFTFQEICIFGNWEPILASDGRQGIQYYISEQPDLILIDYHMPDMNGLQTLKIIRKMDPHIPVMILTVDERQTIADQLMEAGANDFALKPIKAIDMISRINVHLEMAEIKKKNIESTEQVPLPSIKPNLNRELKRLVKKGISKNTLTAIIEYLKKQNQALTIEEVSEGTGVSYPTVHRYLNHLVEENIIGIKVDYGKVGRPKNKYYLIG